MPQLTNITIGPAVSLPAVADKLFRVVPSAPNAQSSAFEHSEVGSPELAYKISASTSRKANGQQASMLRISAPIIRSIEGAPTRVDLNIAQLSCTFAKAATAAERQEVLDTLIRGLKHAFFQSVLVDGEAMT